VLRSYHPGTSIEHIQEKTGWPLRLAPDVRLTRPPAEEELRLIRSLDPQGFWTRAAV
jgi:glutaconate CoA-transferase subunit B